MKLDDRRFLLVKRGLYYRPDNCGYTGIKNQAGRYLESDARPQSGVTAIAEEDAPMFSAACFEDIKIDFLLAKITDLEALVGELGEAGHAIAPRFKFPCTPSRNDVLEEAAQLIDLMTLGLPTDAEVKDVGSGLRAAARAMVESAAAAIRARKDQADG